MGGRQRDVTDTPRRQHLTAMEAERLRLVDLLAALAAASDHAYLLPPDTALRWCVMSTALARRMDLPGLMFFDEPETAFANLARALRPGGRIAFVAPRDRPQRVGHGGRHHRRPAHR